MAKVISPLFSFGASGALGKSIVFFPWKGIDCVRQWVTPANPNSDAQDTQRGYLEAAVDDIHAAMADATHPLGDTDKAAYSTLASIFATPRTWFNSICKIFLDQLRAGKEGTTYRDGSLTPGDGELAVEIYSDEIVATKIETGNFKYGTTKAVLLDTQAATPDLVNHKMTATIASLTNGTKYFVKFVPATVAAYVGADSGIYSGVPAA